MIERKNDWIATLLNAEGHPEITEEVLYANGITPDNTGIKDKDYYRNIPQIQEKFTKDGKFDEVAYNQFYDSALRSYNSYSNDKFVNSLLDYYGTSKYDVSIVSNPAQNVYKTGAVITNFYDRNRHSYGTGNLWEMGNANFSDREIAQANKVRDENGNILDWTPNDKGGLIKGLFRPTLVMASYDNDVYDENGVLIHQKGELKLDENGDPYTELLGNRDSYGKDVVKIADTLTIEGTKLNDWDPFDSDGLNKSIGSTIAKTLFTLGPFFIPHVGPVLGVVAALGGIASAVPTLSKAIDGFITGSDDDEFGRSMTIIENAMSRFGFSQSDAAKGKFLSLENISDIFSTSAGQLFSQRIIGKVPQVLAKLQKTNKINTKLGQQMSLGYMALTSANETYGAFKQAGASDQAAGLGMLATVGGFWWLMNQNYFKGKLFEGTLLDEDQQLRRTFIDASKEINKDVHGTNLEKIVFKEGGFWHRLENAESKVPQFLGRSAKKIKEVAQKLPIGMPGGTENAFISRALNEGIEETMEEGMQDSIKALTKGLELIGVDVTENPDDTLDFGMTPEEMLQRYISSFIGGALGGATFEVFNQVELFRNPELKKLYKMAPVRRMVYDLQDGDNLDRYIRTVDKLYKNGKLGNKNLSATEYVSVADPENKDKTIRVYKQGTDDNNQNLAVRNLLLGIVHQVHDILKENGLVKSSPYLSFYALTNPKLQEEIKNSGLTVAEYWEQNKPDIIASTLHDMGVLDTAVRQAKDIGEQIFNLAQKIKTYELNSERALQLEGNRTELESALKKDKDYQFLQEQLKVLKEQYNNIVSGKNGDEYIGFAYMLLDDSPLKYYTNLLGNTKKNGESKSITTIENFAEVKFKGINYASLDKDSEIKKYIDEQFKEYMTGNEKSFWKIWEFHKALEEKYADSLKKADDFLKDHKIDPFHSSETIGERLTDLTKKRDELLQKLDEFQKDPEEVDPEEVFKIQKGILSLTNQIEIYQQLSPTLHLNEVFNLEKFQQLIDPDLTTEEIDIFSNDEQVNAAKQNVLSYYQYLKDNKIVTPTKEFLTDYLSKYLGKLGLTVNTPMVKKIKERWIKSNFESENFVKFVYGDTDTSVIDPEELLEKLADAREDALGLFVSDSSINKFVSSLDDFLTLLQTNPAQALNKYQELQKELDDKINFDALNALIQDDTKYNAKILLDELLFSKHNDTIDFVSGIIDTINELDVSPTFDILQDLSVKMTGGYNKIIDLLQQQRQNLGSGIESFQLNETMKKALNEAQLLLNVYTALIDSAQSNLNAKVNEYRAPLGKKPFAEISEETKDILLKDIQYLQSQIDYLKTLGGANLEKRLIEQQEIMKNDTVKRIKFFVEPPREYEPLVKKLETILGIKFSDIWKGDFDISSDSKFVDFDKNRMDFESKLFAIFNENSDSQKANLIKSIADTFKEDPTFLTSNAGLLTSDDSTVTAYGMYRYLLLNLLTDSKQVAGWYKTVMKDSPFVPFYSQELIIRDALANYLNRSLYNGGLKVLEQVKNDSNQGKFINECLVLKNFLFINGVPGAGKTAVIANTIKKIIKLIDDDNNTQFISLSMTETQANKLANSIEEPNSGLTWSEFIKVNTETEGEEYKGSDAHKLVKGFKSKVNLKEISKNPESKKYVIFFDEIQLLREPDAIKLNQLIEDANKNGYDVMVFGLGDLMQTSASEKSADGSYNEVSITSTLFNSSFRLSASFRETNQGKSENTLAVASKLQTVMENLYNDKKYDLSKANRDTQDAFSTRTELRWYDDGKTIYGDKFIKSSDIDNIINKLKSYVGQHNSNTKDPEIAIVVETENDKQAYSLRINGDPRVGVYTKTEISGGEFNYVIIDSKLNTDEFLAAKEFYTLMSRARNASFFVAEKTQTLNLYSNDTGTPSAANLLSAKDNETQKQIYDTFKEWRMKLFDSIEEVNIPKKKTESEEEEYESKGGTTFGDEAETVTKKYDTPNNPTEEELNEYIRLAEEDKTQNKFNKEALDSRKKHSNPENDPNKGISVKDRISTTPGDCDIELFENWLQINNPATLGKCILPKIDSDAGIEQYKDFIRYFSSFILNLSPENTDERINQINRIESVVRTGAGEIGDILSQTLRQIQKSLRDGTSYYYTTVIDNNHSLLYYIFTNTKDKSYAIPIGIINGQYPSSVFRTLKSTKVADIAFISSNGKFHLDPRSIAKGKASVGSHYATVINKGKLETRLGLFHQEGKSFAIFGELNKALDDSADEETKDFLEFEIDDDGNVDSYYKLNKKDGEIVGVDYRIRGIQRQLPINEFINLCELIKKEHSTRDLGEWESLKKNIAGIIGLSNYQTNIKLAERLSDEKPDKTPRVRLLSGEARRKFIDAIHKVIGEKPILGNGISSFWFNDVYNKENRPKPVIKISYYQDDGKRQSIAVFLKKVGNKIVWCDSSGKYRNNDQIDSTNSFDIPNEKGSWREFITSLIKSVKNLDSDGSSYSIIPEEISQDDFYSKISVDYYLDGENNGDSYIYPRYVEDIVNIFDKSQLIELKNKLEEDSEFVHGVYLNLQVETFQNKEEGVPSAQWGLNRYNGSGNITSDDVYIFAPIYNIEFSDSDRESRIISELDDPSRPKTKDIVINDSSYTKSENELRFKQNAVRVSKNWLINSVKEDSKKKLPYEGEMFYVHNINPEDKTITIWSNINDIITYRLRDDFDYNEILKNFSEDKHYRTNAWDGNHALVITKDKVYVENTSTKQISDVEFIGENNSGFYYLVDNNYYFYKYDNDEIDDVLKGFLKEYEIRGNILGITEEGPIFVKSSKSGYEFKLLKNNELINVSYDSLTNTISGKNIKVSVNQEFKENLKDFQNNDVRNIKQFKSDIIEEFKKYGMFEDGILDKIEKETTIDGAVEFANDILEENKYLFEDGKRRTIINDNGKFRIDEIPDLTVTIGFILLKQNNNIDAKSIKSIEKINDSLDSNNYLVTLQINGQEEKISYTLFNNNMNQWEIKPYDDIEEMLKPIFELAGNSLTEDNKEFLKQYFKDKQQNKTSIESEETFDMLFNEMSEDVQSQLEDALLKLNEC